MNDVVKSMRSNAVLVRFDQGRVTVEAVPNAAEQKRGGNACSDGYDNGGFRPLRADGGEREGMIRMLVEAGLSPDDAKTAADVLSKGMRASEELPFVDGETGELDEDMIAEALQLFGYDEETAAELAGAIAENISPEELYQPLWNACGGRGPVDLDAISRALMPATADEGMMRDLGACRAANNTGAGMRPKVKRFEPAKNSPEVKTETRELREAKVDSSKIGRDVAALHEAMDGAGTDEAKLINILSNRSNAELNAIKKAYQETYGESLSEAIDGDTDFNFNSTLQSLLSAKRDESGKIDANQITRDASAIHAAVDGIGTDNDKLIDLLTSRSTPQLQAIAKAYQEMYGESLQDAIEGDTTGDFEDVLVAQLNRENTVPNGARAGSSKEDLAAELATKRSAGRISNGLSNGGSKVDQAKVERDAATLFAAMDGAGTDEDAVFNVLSNRSNAELSAIKKAYQETYGESLSEAIDDDFDGNANSTLQAILAGGRDETGKVDPTQITRDAQAIYAAVDGLGTDNQKLIDILTTRSAPQLRELARVYKDMYGETLRDAIEGDTTGAFEDVLVAQLNRQNTGPAATRTNPASTTEPKEKRFALNGRR